MKRLIGIVLALLLVAPVSAQSPQIRQLLLQQMPAAAGGGGGGGSLTFVWQSSTGISGTPAPGNMATLATGTASSDRIAVLGVSWIGTASTNEDITAVTIAGVAATQVAYVRTGTGRGHGIWYAAVPTGTSAVINLTYGNGFIDGLALNLGTITGSATTSAPGGTGIITGAYPAGSTNVSVTVPANGVTVIDANEDTTTATSVTTWTGTFSSSADKDQWSGVSAQPTGSMTHLTTSSAVVNLTAATNSGGTWGWVGASFSP